MLLIFRNLSNLWQSLLDEPPSPSTSDPGPIMMSTPLLPSNYSTYVIGIKQTWGCVAYGDDPLLYKWYKDDQVIRSTHYFTTGWVFEIFYQGEAKTTEKHLVQFKKKKEQKF